MNADISNTPLAPAHPLGQGQSVPGGHYQAYKAQPKFALDAAIKVLANGNPWRPNCPGFYFFEEVLKANPANVGVAIELGAKAKHALKPREVQNHLRWMYTMAGAHVSIGGKTYAAPVAPAPAPKAPTKASSKSKVKA